MQLAIDVGNSRTKYGVFEGEEVLETGLTISDTGAFMKSLFEKFPNISAVIFSSVNEHVDPSHFSLPANIFHISLGPTLVLPIEKVYSSPETLGNDRIALAVAGHHLFPGENSLIIDIGTCMTMEVVTSEGKYLGGSISPGIELRFRAMHEGTASLPDLSFDGQMPELIGDSTKACMESGVIHGMIHEIQGTIKELESQFSTLKVALTGGHSHLFEPALKNTIFADPNLVLLGLNQILLFHLSRA